MNELLRGAINLAMAALVGYLMGGLIGTAVAVVLLVLAYGVWLAIRSLPKNPGDSAAAKLAGEGAGLVGKALAIPLGLIGAAIVMGIGIALSIAQPVLRPLAALSVLATVPGRLYRFGASLFREDVLPWTLGNVILLLLGGVVVIGIDVAFYAALIAVPLLILGLALLALKGGEDPEAQGAGDNH
jgi:hypothetical protein